MGAIQKIKGLLLNGTASEKVIAQYLLSEYPFNAIQSLQEIARHTGRSMPTVQRMVVKLGYKGFPEFRKSILDDLNQEKSTSPLLRMMSKRNGNDGTIYTQTILNIEKTFQKLDVSVLLKAAQILVDTNKNIWCFGGRFTGTLATLFARHLKTIRPRVREFIPYEGALADLYADTDEKTVLFVTDIRRYDQPTIKLCEASKEKQATIILITDNWLSPAEKYADVVVPVYTNSSSGWDSNACLLVVLEEIMAIATDLLGESARHELLNREKFINKVN